MPIITRELHEPELDVFCIHDRAVRESGHDVSMRTEGVCADLGTVDLNCLLYKYERDIAHIIHTVFDDKLHIPTTESVSDESSDKVESSANWDRAASRRKQLIDKYFVE